MVWKYFKILVVLLRADAIMTIDPHLHYQLRASVKFAILQESSLKKQNTEQAKAYKQLIAIKGDSKAFSLDFFTEISFKMDIFNKG